MGDRIRFHLDEHVDPAVAIALRRAGIDVTTTNETGLRAKDDKTHLNFARDQNRVIVTRDQDFLRLVSGAANHPGIVYYTGSQSLREIIEGLILIAKDSGSCTVCLESHRMLSSTERFGISRLSFERAHSRCLEWPSNNSAIFRPLLCLYVLTIGSWRWG
ncbi:MAG: DUF5615 family PIN-like protein [Acidobacteriota bacterium]|nr:DUF5615 family PIN-like protein [Acidobacteriota bacterium]